VGEIEYGKRKGGKTGRTGFGFTSQRSEAATTSQKSRAEAGKGTACSGHHGIKKSPNRGKKKEEKGVASLESGRKERIALKNRLSSKQLPQLARRNVNKEGRWETEGVSSLTSAKLEKRR